MRWRCLVVLALLAMVSTAQAQIDEQLVAEFAESFAYRYRVPQEKINAILQDAEYKQDIIDKMDKPAEGTMTWGRYRKIFIKEDRIAAGVDFWKANEAALSKVTSETGVPEEIILGILGVETFYGQRIGNYRVLDALYTLAFGYPKRASFFKAELEKFLELCEKENLDVHSLRGSYAGAIGYCQFMPSSYLAYAKSYDDDHSRNLMEVNDAIASVANYLGSHKWQPGSMITLAVKDTINPQEVLSKTCKPDNTLRYYSDNGYIPSGNVTPSAKAALIMLEGEEGEREYWFSFNNFYVITRYNRSPMYAMAVYELGEEVKKRYLNSAP